MSFRIKEIWRRHIRQTSPWRGERDLHFLKFFFPEYWKIYRRYVASFRFFARTLSTINLAFAKPLMANNVENYFKALARVSSKFIVTRTF
jgi:hypothetical protein